MIKLYTYFRSTAAYRVRIALNLKNIEHEAVSVNLLTGEEAKPEYAAINPQKLVPALEIDGRILYQSMAILEYLEENHPEPPLLPADSTARAEVRALANAIACDIHPLNNLRVLEYLKQELGVSGAQRDTWYAHWIHEGFRAAEMAAERYGGPFVFGESVTLADACLIPQMYNARRFEVSLVAYPKLRAVEAHCNSLPEFSAAAPESQPDA